MRAASTGQGRSGRAGRGEVGGRASTNASTRAGLGRVTNLIRAVNLTERLEQLVHPHTREPVMATWKTLAMSFSTAYDPNSLEGLPGVTLEVHLEHDDALGAVDGQDGLTAESLQADVELNLRIARIPLLEEEPSVEIPSVPVLSVTASIVEVADLGGVHAFGLTLGLSQVVTLPGGPRVSLQTWNRGHVGFAASSRVRNLVREQVREKTKAFVDAWLMVNRD